MALAHMIRWQYVVPADNDIYYKRHLTDFICDAVYNHTFVTIYWEDNWKIIWRITSDQEPTDVTFEDIYCNTLQWEEEYFYDYYYEHYDKNSPKSMRKYMLDWIKWLWNNKMICHFEVPNFKS